MGRWKSSEKLQCQCIFQAHFIFIDSAHRDASSVRFGSPLISASVVPYHKPARVMERKK